MRPLLKKVTVSVLAVLLIFMSAPAQQSQKPKGKTPASQQPKAPQEQPKRKVLKIQAAKGHAGAPQPNIASTGPGMATRGYLPIPADSTKTNPLEIGITLLLLPASPTARGMGLPQKASEAPAVRVSPTREFVVGDRLRLVFEPSEDGYLYIFHQENKGAPQMLFPDPRLDGGNNAVRAHVPLEIPSLQTPNPDYRWFVFDERPARERLTLFFVRQLLDDVPIGEALRATGSQSWKPPAKLWTRLISTAKASPLTWSEQTDGTEWTPTENRAAQSRSALGADAPAPGIVVSVKDPDAGLMAVIELKHR